MTRSDHHFTNWKKVNEWLILGFCSLHVCCCSFRSEARFGEGHQEAADALRLCATAHVARFGPVGPGLLQLLMDTRAGVALL